MTLAVAYDLYDEYLHTKVTGELTTSGAQQVFRDMVEKARCAACDRILCDVSAVQDVEPYMASASARFELSVFVAETMPRECRLAVVIAPHQIRDDFGEMVMTNRGANVKVTGELEEGLDWLGVSPGGG